MVWKFKGSLHKSGELREFFSEKHKSKSQSPLGANDAKGSTSLHFSSPRPHICECSESYSGGLVHLFSFPILLCQAPDEKAMSTISIVFSMT